MLRERVCTRTVAVCLCRPLVLGKAGGVPEPPLGLVGHARAPLPCTHPLWGGQNLHVQPGMAGTRGPPAPQLASGGGQRGGVAQEGRRPGLPAQLWLWDGSLLLPATRLPLCYNGVTTLEEEAEDGSSLGLEVAPEIPVGRLNPQGKRFWKWALRRG